MPEGKAAGVRCIHLSEDYRCLIYDSPERPRVCAEFQAEEAICGKDREEAMMLLGSLEKPA